MLKLEGRQVEVDFDCFSPTLSLRMLGPIVLILAITDLAQVIVHVALYVDLSGHHSPKGRPSLDAVDFISTSNRIRISNCRAVFNLTSNVAVE